MRLKKSMCQSPGYGKTQLNEPPYFDFNFIKWSLDFLSQQQLDTEALSQSETFCEEYSKFSKLWLLNLLSHLKLQLNKTRIFQCQFQKMKEKS